jgi:hypothetical protein
VSVSERLIEELKTGAASRDKTARAKLRIDAGSFFMALK